MYKMHKYWFKIYNLLLFAAFQAIDKEILKINISCLLAIYFDFLAFWLIAHPENVYYAHTSLLHLLYNIGEVLQGFQVNVCTACKRY